MKVTLVCGGPSSEHEVSINSTKSLYEAIDKSKYEVSVFYITKDLNCIYFEPEKELNIPEDTSTYVPFMEGVENYKPFLNFTISDTPDLALQPVLFAWINSVTPLS